MNKFVATVYSAGYLGSSFFLYEHAFKKYMSPAENVIISGVMGIYWPIIVPVMSLTCGSLHHTTKSIKKIN